MIRGWWITERNELTNCLGVLVGVNWEEDEPIINGVWEKETEGDTKRTQRHLEPSYGYFFI